MQFERYRWQDHVITGNRWLMDVPVAVVLLALLAAASLLERSSSPVSQAATAHVPPALHSVEVRSSDWLTPKGVNQVTWSRRG
jgi:hypothetical protein